MENFLSQWYHVKRWKKFFQQLWKKFSWMRKNRFKIDFLALSLHIFTLLVSNQTVFLIQFGINFFKKLKLHTTKWLMQFLTLSETKTHSSKLISKLNSKLYDNLQYNNYLWIHTLALLKNDERKGVENSSSRALRVLKKKIVHKWHWWSIKKPEWFLITAISYM